MHPYNFGASGNILMKLFQATWHKAVAYNFRKARTLKFGRAKDVQISARFLTTFDFDREFPRNGSTYRTFDK